MRVVQLAETCEVHLRTHGVSGALAMARERSGKQFDPSLVQALTRTSIAYQHATPTSPDQFSRTHRRGVGGGRRCASVRTDPFSECGPKERQPVCSPVAVCRGGSEALVGECVSGMPAARALGAAMAELARALQQEHTNEHATLDAVTAAAVAAVPGAEYAAISLVVRGRTVQSRAATEPLAERMDAAQTALGQGPCLDAVWEQESVHIPDMAAESRWPRFTATAAEAGIGAMLCCQLFVADGRLGALNLYASQAGAFDEDARFTGLIFATHAAVAITGARQEETLSTALANRDLIGQAKGIVMERFHLDATRAFALLARLSQAENIKLRDLAVQLVADVADSPASSPGDD